MLENTNLLSRRGIDAAKTLCSPMLNSIWCSSAFTGPCLTSSALSGGWVTTLALLLPPRLSARRPHLSRRPASTGPHLHRLLQLDDGSAFKWTFQGKSLLAYPCGYVPKLPSPFFSFSHPPLSP